MKYKGYDGSVEYSNRERAWIARDIYFSNKRSKPERAKTGIQNPSNKRCKPKKTNLGVQNPQLKFPLWDPSKDADRDGIINPKYKIT